jgi:hypothetical protein
LLPAQKGTANTNSNRPETKFYASYRKIGPKRREHGGRAFRNEEGNPHYPDKLDKALEMAHKTP